MTGLFVEEKEVIFVGYSRIQKIDRHSGTITTLAQAMYPSEDIPFDFKQFPHWKKEETNNQTISKGLL